MSNTNQKSTNWVEKYTPFHFLYLGYNIMREEGYTKATFAFAMLYFCELSSYLTFILCIPGENLGKAPMLLFSNTWLSNVGCSLSYAVMLFSGTMIGGIATSLIIAKYNHKVKTVLKFSVWVYLSATITHLLTAIYVLNYGENSYTEALKLMAYFDFGAGFASSIGLIVSQVVEKLPRYNRSFTIGIIHAIGFVSPMIIAFIFIQNGENNDISKIICLVISSIFALFSAFNTDNIPDDALFRSGEKHSVKTWLGWLGLNPSLSEQDSEGDARSFWLSALTGANMIFFFFLFTNVNKVYIQKVCKIMK